MRVVRSGCTTGWVVTGTVPLMEVRTVVHVVVRTGNPSGRWHRTADVQDRTDNRAETHVDTDADTHADTERGDRWVC
jgi:hypothetical protein